ncbi:MAG: two-component sensor histidine kinase [Tannerellaceae bacterium]|jgi:two-component system OmpR family sensor kinase/two-component system phosphate regulon sensor histidine kinase PhoR|nr:two-component sensor histidine kinase [Tannerellaceae bacterium]
MNLGQLADRQRIFIYILLVFIAFAASVILVERRQESKLRTAEAISRIDGYAETANAFMSRPDSLGRNIAELCSILPDSVRISIIDFNGNVQFDSEAGNPSRMDNHLDRSEIAAAKVRGAGHAVRTSASTGKEYFYYARRFGRHFVRVALPYNAGARNMLRPNNLFIYVTITLFAVAAALVAYMARRFGKSVIRLKDLASEIKRGGGITQASFPNDELGEISTELVEIFKQGELTRQHIQLEREKLIRHFRFSGEGLCIFSSEMKKIYANTNFIQYVNLISDTPILDVENILYDPMFRPVTNFIANAKRTDNYSDFRIEKNAKIFSIQAIVFHDESFEIIIKDTTRAEKTKLLKQEMTGNIAHELRTPVTTLRAYLETLSSRDLDPERQRQFIDRAYLQSVRLSNLIDDAGIISKIEDAPSQFILEDIILADLVDEVFADLHSRLEASRISHSVDINPNLAVKGSYTLLYSIFRNLIDNSISYAGPGIEIRIINYADDDNYLYFSYYDTGSGVDERHLSRLFERFYRVSEGRTRDTGGSGLGLSIVKNAVLFHKGDIQVKNRRGGGLEFLFTIRK